MNFSPLPHHVQLLLVGNFWSLHTSSWFFWTPFVHNSMLTIYFGNKMLTWFYCVLLVVIFFGRNFESLKYNFEASSSPSFTTRRCFTHRLTISITWRNGSTSHKNSFLASILPPMKKWLLSDWLSSHLPQGKRVPLHFTTTKVRNNCPPLKADHVILISIRFSTAQLPT